MLMRFTTLLLVIGALSVLAVSASSPWYISVYPWGFASYGTPMPAVTVQMNSRDLTACKEEGLRQVKTLSLYLRDIKTPNAIVVCSKGCKTSHAVQGAMECDEVHRWTGEGEKYAIQD